VVFNPVTNAIRFRVLRGWVAPFAAASLVGLFGVLAIAGCKSKPENASASATAPPRAAASSVTSATAATAPAGHGGRPVVTIQDKLENEKGARPTDTPKAEDVYAALGKNGLPIREERQHVASIFGAKYCLGGKSGVLAYSVCEYESPEAAKSGRDMSLKTLAVPNRAIFVNKKTTLTVRQPPLATKESEAATQKSADVFAKL
jgi:hypothetical protein